MSQGWQRACWGVMRLRGSRTSILETWRGGWVGGWVAWVEWVDWEREREREREWTGEWVGR